MMPPIEPGILAGARDMIPGIHSAASAMQHAAARHEVISNNLAHIDMPGFRRTGMVAESSFARELKSVQEARRQERGSGAPQTQEFTDFSPGRMMQTGNPLDVAINGEGFFVVETSGESLYTRNGTFQLDSDGKLTTADGHPVSGENGPIQIPPGTSISNLKITSDGAAFINGSQIGKLRIVSFDDAQQLEAAGTTLFRAPEDIVPVDADASVAQGVRESSNVNAMQELVDLIATNRAHESAQRAMNTIAQALQRRTDLRGT